MEDFVKARLNGEADRGLALLYKVQQFPTVVFLDSQGRELDRFSGFADPSALLRWAAEAIDPKTNYVLLKERLAANPADVEALYYMGFKYTRRSAYDHARKYFDRVEKLDKDNKFGFLDNILLRRAEESLQAGYFDAALKLLDGFGQKYPDSDELDRAELLQARLLWLVGRTDEAMKAYRRFLVAFPQSDLRNQAEASVQALSPAPQPAPEPTPLPGPILPGT
jgi:thioredoxin-like negative regulator of GroEL